MQRHRRRRSRADPALGSAGRGRPPGHAPHSAPPLWDFPTRGRSRRAAERLLGVGRPVRRELSDVPPPPRAPHHPGACHQGSKAGSPGLCRRRRRPPHPGDLTHLGADRRIPAGHPPETSRWARVCLCPDPAFRAARTSALCSSFPC